MAINEISRCSKSKIIISTGGFSSLMMALYAKHGTIQKVEWSFYKLSKELEEETSFSPGWKSIMKDFIQENFKDLYFSDLKVPIVINLSNKRGEPKEFYKGKLTPILLAALNIRSYQGYRFNSPNKNNLFSDKYISRLAKNWKILLNLYVSKPVFRHDRGYLWGKYSQIAQAVNHNEIKFFNIFEIKNTLAIDEASNISRFFGKHFSQEQICQLLKENKITGSQSN